MDPDLIKSLPGRRGHFLLESGYHTDFWFTLDALFVEPKQIAGEVHALAELLRPHDVSAVCGPLLGGAFLAQALAAHLNLRFYYTQQVFENGLNRGGGLFSARYSLPKALRVQVRNERVAIVDDFISAGSSVRATADELKEAGATTAVVGSMMLLGNEAREYFSKQSVPVVSVTKQEFNLWPPSDCPLCQTNSPLENPVQVRN